MLVVASGVYWRHIAAPSRAAIIIEPAGAGGQNSGHNGGNGDGTDQKIELKEIIVHVAGAVKESGVYSIVEGSRIIDAVVAAGGADAEADLDAINLAQPVIDGQKVWVPKMGEEISTERGTAGQGSAGASILVNINSAGLAELQTLPGIGPSYAQRIIDFRAENGPFRQVEDVMNVSGIGEKRFQDLKRYITVY
jgi:competence protein ComEA